jgi:hypothetical protein
VRQLIESAVLRALLRRVGRAFLWPFRRFFDPRFRGLEQVVDEKHGDLVAHFERLNRRFDKLADAVGDSISLTTAQLQDFRSLLAAAIDTTNESNIVIGRTLSELLEAIDETLETIRSSGEGLEKHRSPASRQNTENTNETARLLGPSEGR